MSHLALAELHIRGWIASSRRNTHPAPHGNVSMATVTPEIHIVDDDASMREALGGLWERRASRSACIIPRANSSWSGRSKSGCLLLDVRMPGPRGLDLQQALVQRADAPPVVFLTGYGDIPMSVLAIQRGAVDFLTKPVDREALPSRSARPWNSTRSGVKAIAGARKSASASRR